VSLFLLIQRDPLKPANFLAVFSNSALISDNSIPFTSLNFSAVFRKKEGRRFAPPFLRMPA
jgi:hypothetical protein